MVAVCFAVATLAWGFGFYGQGVYLAHLLKLRGWSLSLVSGAVTGFYFVSAIMVAFVADWIARFGAPLALWLIEAPAAPSAAGEARPAAQRKGELLRSFRFWSIAGAFAIVWVTQTAFLTHEINIFAPVLGTSGAATAVAATTLAAVAGRLAMGSVVDRLDKRLTTALSVVSQAAALVALVLWPQPAVIWAAAMVYGLSVGNVITLPALIVQHEFDPRAFGGVVALLTSVTQMFGAFGPALLGLGRDLAGGYGPPIVCCALLNVCAGAAVLLLRPGPRHA